VFRSVFRSQQRAIQIAACALIVGSIAASRGSIALAIQTSDVERQGETTTVLADGRVLIAGGDAQGSAEIHDPSTGESILLAARMSTPRAYHSAVRLADGNVLILGGYAAETQSIEGSAEIFVVSEGTFAKTAGAPQSARVQPTLTCRTDGVVVVSGGTPSGPIEFYDPDTRTFGPDPAAASVVTDREDYAPGETVTFIGRRWVPGETVRITLHEAQPIHGDRELFATANDSGEFVNTDFAPEPHHLGVTFEVTATGTTSGRLALWTFTDGAPPSTSYTITQSTGTIFTGGSPADIGIHCDDCTTRIPLPFPVTVYDQTYSSAVVSSNGNVQFTGDSNAWGNGPLPNSAFGAALLPYWDDLDPRNAEYAIRSQTTGSSPNRVFHLWWHTRHVAGAGAADFELLIYENVAQFDVIYGGGVGGSATIGIQKSLTGPFTMYSSNARIESLAGVRLSFLGNGLGTSTTTSSSANPTVFGQSTSVTAAVMSGGSPVTSGTVTFSEGSRTLAGPITLDGAGKATFSTSGLSVGIHVITATFNGNSTQTPSSGSVTHRVNSASTTTTVSSTANPGVFGHLLTLRANVSVNVPGNGTASGIVQFQADGVNIGLPVMLSGGSATASISTLGEGTHTISATYFGDGNFNSSSGSLSQIVNRASSITTVSVNENPAVFGQPVTFTATVAALEPGAGIPSGTVQFKDGQTDLGPAVSLAGGTATFTTSNLSGGSHAITAAYAGDSGFIGSNGAVDHVVNKATPSLSARGGTFVYDGQPHAATATATGVSGEPLGPVTLTYSAAGESQTPPTHAGTYTVAASYAGSANYAAATARATLTITPVPLRVKADDRTKVYGSSNPTFTATVTGYVNGETASSLAGTLSFTTTATETSGIGGYAITPGGWTSIDYAIEFVDGTLTVSKATALVTPHGASKIYGSPDPTLSGTLSGFLAVDRITATYSRTSGETVRTYPISATLSPASALANYEITYDAAIFEITRKAASVAPLSANKVYGSADPTLSGTLSGFLATDGVTATYSRTSGETVGTYPISATLGPAAVLANYDITHGTASFTVTAATLTVTAADQAKVYGSPDPSLTYGVNGLRFNDTVATVLTGALARDPGEGVGRYMIRQGTLAANGNYIINFTNGTLTISYNTCLLYDPMRAVKSGATIPIKIQLCSASAANVSSPTIVVTADELTLASTSTSAAVEDAGNANPDDNFRFDRGLGPGYIFNLKTTGLGTGTYHLRFTATNDPEPHIVSFQVR
jgi:hypothetical protein